MEGRTRDARLMDYRRDSKNVMEEQGDLWVSEVWPTQRRQG